MSTLKETISAPTALQGKDQGATNSQVDAATRHHPATEEKVEAEMPSTAESPDETEHATGKSKDPTAPTRNIETVGLVVEKAEADFKLMPITLDEVRPNEVLVEMKYSGICHTVRSFVISDVTGTVLTWYLGPRGTSRKDAAD